MSWDKNLQEWEEAQQHPKWKEFIAIAERSNFQPSLMDWNCWMLEQEAI